MKEVTLDDLSQSMGHGVIGAEICCEKCSEHIDLFYIYSSHLWGGTCYGCDLGYVVDLEWVISQAIHSPYVDWDEELKKLF